jgi:hypothetical protein
VVLGQGGPDNYGYKWIDSDEPGGPAFNWVDISGIGTPISMSDDDNQGPYALPFSFNYYGTNYNSFRVCSNGWISFTSTETQYSNTAIPSSSAPLNMIAPFWDDMNPSAGGSMYYYVTEDSAVISWVGVPHYYSTGSYTFQVVLLNGGAIILNYLTLDDVTSATVGIQNASGNDGLQVAYNTSYLHNDLAIKLSAGWLEVNPMTGIIPAGGQVTLDVTFDAGAQVVGEYDGHIIVQSYDAIHTLPDVEVPVKLNVVNSLGDLSLAMYPDEPPVTIPAGGGHFDFSISVTNNLGTYTTYDAWIMLRMPGGWYYGPLIRGTVGIGANAVQVFNPSQAVPGFAPPGVYNYVARVGSYPSSITDEASFPFEKLTVGLGNVGSWELSGFMDGSLAREGDVQTLPTSYSLSQNYPNPFNAQSVINYALPNDGEVELTVYNLMGQKVETLVDGHQTAGYKSVTWDASQYASGVYFYKLNAGETEIVKRMTLVK